MSPRGTLPALAPLGRLYLGASAIRNRLYDRGLLRSEAAGIPVVGVGNVTAGGVGKTPAVRWLAGALARGGRRVAIVSRGYGGRRTRDPLVVARDGELLATLDEAGDEALMQARARAASLVVVGRERLAAARLAREEGAELVVLDDGFQHRALARDVDLVLLDHTDPLGGGRGLPAGLLREAPGAAFERASALVLTRAPVELAALERALGPDEWPPPLVPLLRALDAPPPLFAARHAVRGLRDESGEPSELDALAGRALIAVSAIGRPDALAQSLEECGAHVVARFTRPDHHLFDARDAAALERLAREHGAPLVTTEKDRVRWPAGAPAPLVLEIAFASGAQGALEGLVRARLGKMAR